MYTPIRPAGLRILASFRVPSYNVPFCAKMSSTKKKIAVLQLNVKDNKEDNFQTSKRLLEEAKREGAVFAFLPECFDFIGEDSKFTLENAETINGPLISKYKSLAKSLDWLSLGGFHEKINDEMISNTHLIINSEGKLVSEYRKLHLFDVNIPGRVSLQESKYVLPGKHLPPAPFNSSIGRVGLSICYDLRFPEIALYLRQAHNSDILTFPSAFTVPTGEAHWEVLLRSRAIETQCYVVAAAQVGVHNAKRASYGHSLVIDPWGKVIADGGREKEGICFAEIDLDRLKKVREEMPVMQHRREDLYGLITSEAMSSLSMIHDEYNFHFGKIFIKGSSVVFASKQSYCSVNKCPILPGHLLVMPQRFGAVSLSDLTVTEISDLFLSVKRAQMLLNRFYGVSSTTVAIQDGIDAGRTIDHLHVHILPRKSGDFKKKDDIYTELQDHDKENDRKWRTEEEMKEEANAFREFLLKEKL
ncbi:LOW QUALITY PROTEIN: nitrilase and fragile histidine triad fusion protein NitFhit [Lepeophtheirus salmonis]|uniref:LOW QUALITY PROTEIN: nitrilase and fragile histidine triad fusion protein NitFhit n=1 Tax=Lepeophtheirus salmonis TaxID=72036 RepID=UPI001AE25443|nr:LOW QUALITY PROTEIN: nitrilase and fragile histidine triad fusion protein NitFhit-like [Lepeophtheirus salmonis]